MGFFEDGADAPRNLPLSLKRCDGTLRQRGAECRGSGGAGTDQRKSEKAGQRQSVQGPTKELRSQSGTAREPVGELK